MAYIYKLVDAVGLALAKEGKILLSRPIFSFPDSEGRFIGFAHRINERYSKQKENVKPSEKNIFKAFLLKESINSYCSSPISISLKIRDSSSLDTLLAISSFHYLIKPWSPMNWSRLISLEM